MTIRELWHISPSKTIIKTADLDISDPEKLLIKTLYTLISSGTESVVCKGNVPPEIWNSMQVPNMEGGFVFPLKYGYSLVGEVIKGDEKWMGKKVHLMNPHQDYAFVLPEQVTEIPPDIPPQRAVLASIMETAVNAVWDSKISTGDCILVNGFGVVGAVVAILVSQFPGVQLCVHEINEERVQLAQSLGLNTDIGKCEQFDVSFNTSSTGSGLQYCIEKTGFEGSIIELSWFGSNMVELNLGALFHIRRQRIIGSQVSSIPGFKVNRWDKERRKNLVFDLLKNKLYDSLLETKVHFMEGPAIFDMLRNDSKNKVCYIFQY